MIIKISLCESPGSTYQSFDGPRKCARDRDKHSCTGNQGKKRQSQYPSIHSIYQLRGACKRLKDDKLRYLNRTVLTIGHSETFRCRKIIYFSKFNLSVLRWQLQQFAAAGNELLLQLRTKRADDHSSIDGKSNLRRSGFADRSCNMFIDRISNGDKAEKGSVLLRSKVERLRRYLVDTVTKGEQNRFLRSMKAYLQSLGNPGSIKRRAAIVGCDQTSFLIEQGKEIGSAYLPELDSAIFDRSLIVGGH